MSEVFSLLGFQWRHQIISALRAIALVTFVFPVLFWHVLWVWVFRGIDPNISHELISTLKRLKYSQHIYVCSKYSRTDRPLSQRNHTQWYQRILSILDNNSIHTPEPGTRKRDGDGNAHDERARGETWDAEGNPQWRHFRGINNEKLLNSQSASWPWIMKSQSTTKED